MKTATDGTTLSNFPPRAPTPRAGPPPGAGGGGFGFVLFCFPFKWETTARLCVCGKDPVAKKESGLREGEGSVSGNRCGEIRLNARAGRVWFSGERLLLEARPPTQRTPGSRCWEVGDESDVGGKSLRIAPLLWGGHQLREQGCGWGTEENVGAVQLRGGEGTQAHPGRAESLDRELH